MDSSGWRPQSDGGGGHSEPLFFRHSERSEESITSESFADLFVQVYPTWIKIGYQIQLSLPLYSF